MKNEYRFKIEAYTPDTFPMARCADYLCELANMLGESPYVHFVGLRSGCVEIAYSVDNEAVPKVTERIETIKRGQGTVTEMKAYKRINTMLREDNGRGAIIEDNNAKIIEFPGKEEEALRLASVKQQGKMDGEVIRIGGSKDIVHITLEIEGKEISGFITKRTIAKELAKNLFEPVRLYGEGRWERDEEGEWNLKSFRVDRFEVLKESKLSNTVLELRKFKGEWGKNALKELLDLRHSNDGGK
ncbi:MAG TPA: hypothetical protein PKI70_06375 [Mesotoga sp.]|nr:hypothetical protein [Mesotoga sp.]